MQAVKSANGALGRFSRQHFHAFCAALADDSPALVSAWLLLLAAGLAAAATALTARAAAAFVAAVAVVGTSALLSPVVLVFNRLEV